MWSVAQLCRCTQSLRSVQTQLISGTKNFNTLSHRQLITPARYNAYKGNSYKGYRLGNLLKSNGIVVRLCSSAPKPKSSKAVGYWLLGCSGMVFTAVVLGMVAGYLILLYSIYYIVNLILSSTNGSK